MFFRASFRGLERSGERRASNACGAGDESVSVRADACACFEFLRGVGFLLVTDDVISGTSYYIFIANNICLDA